MSEIVVDAAPGSEITGKPAINLNRGLTLKTLPGGGAVVSMCKSTPGIYFDAAGNRASDEMATAAGFDVRVDRLKGLRDQRLAEATERINKDMEELIAREEAEITKATDPLNPNVEDPEAFSIEMPEGLPAVVAPVDDGSTFVEPNEKRPRRCRLEQDGPIREIKYNLNGDQFWELIVAGEVVQGQLIQEDAVRALMEA